MAIKAIWCRRSLLAGAALLFVVVLIFVAAVIPSIRADTSPVANPKTAAASAWVVVVFNLLAGTTLFVIVAQKDVGGCLPHVGLRVLAILVFVFALWLLDAALGFGSHGPAMLRTDMLISFCAAAELGASVLVGAAAITLGYAERGSRLSLGEALRRDRTE
jgi:hypothetical protein